LAFIFATVGVFYATRNHETKGSGVASPTASRED
jgi:hypothetical protein